MYHLLINGGGEWGESKGDMPVARVFEYTEDYIAEEFKTNDKLDLKKVASIPAIFTTEIFSDEPDIAHVGKIHKVRHIGNNILIQYSFEQGFPPLTNIDLKEMRKDLDIKDFEFHRTHWAIKDVDLYEVLIKSCFPSRVAPEIFKMDEIAAPDEKLISVMMPFDSSFNDVYKAIKKAAKGLEADCLRADDIWEDATIIQDVFSLIYRSRVVICDCSGRNSNVFYEAGIAHTLGREVILITQSKDDIPFDLQHLRYIHYLNNAEGRRALVEKLKQRIETLLNSAR